jgi:hypothetical protein
MVIEHRPKRTGPRSGPDLLEAASAVSEQVLTAAHDASKQLALLAIPHALIGGIAVAAHGAPRATKDVDFLVNEKDAFSGTAILSFKQGVPIAVRGVVIDYLTPDGSPHADLLRQALVDAQASEGIPVIPLEPLVVMKLQAGRRRDLDDVQRLLEPADLQAEVRSFIVKHAPELVPRLDLALADGA